MRLFRKSTSILKTLPLFYDEIVTDEPVPRHKAGRKREPLKEFGN